MLEKVAKYVVLIVGIPIMLALTWYSFRYTVFFGLEYQQIPHYRGDSVLSNLLYSLIVILIFTCIWKITGKKENHKSLEKGIVGCVLLAIFGACVWWIYISQTAPAADQRYVWVGAEEFMQGNYRYLENGKYFQYYPHQLTMVLFCQIFMKLFSTTDFHAYQVFNAVCIVAAIYFLWKIFCIFSKKSQERILCILILGMCFPLFLYAPFVYNDVVSLTFMLISFYCILKYKRDKKWYHSIGCIAFMTMAVMCRKNMLVAVIALLIFLGMMFVKEKHWPYVVIGVAALGLSLSIHPFVTNYYEKQSGIEIGNGTTSMAYIAMGMQEGLLAEGWYNKFNEQCYEESGFQKDECNRIAKENIAERLETFKKNPAYCLEFYKNKILKQWNEPTYGGFINNSYHDHRGLSDAANSMYYGKLHQTVLESCNIYQQLIFLFSLIFLIYGLIHKIELDQMLLFVVFLGGFFFHILWEGDSRYVMPYFTMLIPYGVWGIGLLQNHGKGIILKVRQRLSRYKGECR